MLWGLGAAVMQGGFGLRAAVKLGGAGGLASFLSYGEGRGGLRSGVDSASSE